MTTRFSVQDIIACPSCKGALAATKDFAGVTGVITMGPNHNPIKGVTVIKVDQGQFVYQTTINP